MVNYTCTAACRHCLYACSPARGGGGYISKEIAREVCGLLREGGCVSVHIGGGEPFLDFQGLLAVVKALRTAGIRLEYIETNAYWAMDASATETLRALAGEGVESLCISLDPYHAEYVPYEYPLRLARLCRKLRMGYFLWKEQFLPVLSRLDGTKAHSRKELEAALAPHYVGDTARAYGIYSGGRAVNIEAEYRDSRPVAALLDEAAGQPCENLLSTGHFHVDLLGNFIPPGCTGIRLPLAEAVRGIPPGKYPVFEALYSGGLGALYSLAREQGFTGQAEGYPSGCVFCFHMRHYLSRHGAAFAELDAEHYEEALRYY